MNIELRHLTYLLAVADKGSIGKAAESLGISQPAVTKSIRKLEAALQVKLLERRPRGVVPTVYGDAVIARARTFRLQTRDLLDELQSLRTGIGGIVKVGMAIAIANRIGPLAVLRVLNDHPNIRVSARMASADQLVAFLVAGEIEFAVAPFGAQNYGSAVVEEFLFYDQPQVVVRSDHPLTRYAQLLPQQLIHCRWIVAGFASPLRRAFDRVFVSEGLSPPTPIIESNLVIFTKRILMQTDFCAFYPRDQISAEETTQFTGIPIKTNVQARSVGILRRRSETLSTSAELLAAAVRAVCRDLGYMTDSKSAIRTVVA